MAAATLMIPATIAVIILMLIPADSDAFTTSKPLFNLTSDITKLTCNLGHGKRLIGDDIETEFLMESHVSRILADELRFETMRTPIAGSASVVDCERPPRYDSCLGEARDIPPPENCDAFNRANPC